MSAFTWLRSLAPRLRSRRGRQLFRHSRRGHCLRLERLEDRLAPADYTVISTGDAGSGSGTSGDLRYCVSQANADASNGQSDTIRFAASLNGQTITLSQVLDLSGFNSSTPATITIDGGGQITIDGDNATGLISVEQDVNVVLSGLTFSHGNAGNVFDTSGTKQGGAIANNGTLTVSGCTFSHNSAVLGGCVFNSGMLTVSGSTFSNNGGSIGGCIANNGTLTVSGSTFSNNSVTFVGGGISNNGTLTVSDSTFSNNSATFSLLGATNGSGGGISNGQGATLAVSNCTFSNNNSGGTGGGIDNVEGTLTVSNCTFSNNKALVHGGGISNTGTMEVNNSTFSSNSCEGIVLGIAAGNGGGIDSSGTLTVNNSTFSNNSTVIRGGGISNSGTLEVNNSTFSSNSCKGTVVNGFPLGSGGGIDSSDTLTVNYCTFSNNSTVGRSGGISNSGTMSLQNSIVAGNSATTFDPDVGGSFNDLGHNVLGTALQGVGGSGDVFTDTPGLAPLGNYGGPTQTMALLLGSPALGAGVAVEGISTDQRGQPRVVEGLVDVGAFQNQISLSPPPAQNAGQDVATLRDLGSFSDLMSDVSSWHVSIDWGDDHGDTLDASSQGALPGQSHSYTSAGVFTVTVTVSDSDGNVDRDSFQVNVDAPLTAGALTPPTATEGRPVTNLVLLHFSDADPDGSVSDFVATVSWGDGSVESNGANVQVVANAGGGFDVVGSHTYLEAGSGLAFVVQVQDIGGASPISAGATIDVADAPLTAGMLTPPDAAVAAPISNAVLFHFSDANPNSVAADYVATVTWGDGTTSTLSSTPSADGQIVANPSGGFDVFGSHVYLQGGPLRFAVAVLDEGGASTSQSGSVTVSTDAVLPGTAGDDVLLLTRVRGGPIGSVSYVLNNNSPVTLNNVTSFTFNGSDGNDSMTVSLVDGRPLVPGFVRFDGGAGSNALVVDAASDGLDGIVLTQPGQVTVDAQAVGFTNVGSTNLNNAVAVNTIAGADTADRDAAFAGLSPNERFVQALYLDALGRAGSRDELDGWLSLLTGPGGQQAVASAIEGSFEARDRLVKTWYVGYLGRQAQDGEQSVWVRRLQAGESEEQVLAAILGDSNLTEFYQRAQQLVLEGTAEERYVQALYRLLLGRAASSGELVGWRAALSGLGREGLALAILRSAEYRVDLFESDYVARLHRPGDAAGLDGWLASGLDAHGARIAFLSSPEFFANG